MLILGVDTSARLGSIALITENKPVAELTLDLSLSQSERLIPLIDFLLEQSGYTLADVGLIAVASGPGSYTGLRVSLAMAKGLCFAAGIPLVLVGTFDAVVHKVGRCNLPIAPIIDAKMGEVFCALYSDGDVVVPTAARALDDFLGEIPEGAQVRFEGIDAHLFRDAIENRLGKRAYFSNLSAMHAGAVAVAELGFIRYKHNGSVSLDDAVPEYRREFIPKKPKGLY